MFNFFKKDPASFLGIDIGTTSIKVVQLGREDKNIKLENYAFLEDKDYLEVLGNANGSSNLKISDAQVIDDLIEIKKEAGIICNNAIMSVPISSAFSSIISLPNMPKDEISRAVSFEARQYIPIPINEVVFDWSIISEDDKNNKEENNNRKSLDARKKIKILLVAIPKEITEKYTTIASALKLNLIALETESFSLARSLIANKEGIFTIVDIGNKMTNVTVIENGFVLASHSAFGTGGREITKAISHGFDIDFKRAEKLKRDAGLSFSESQKKVSEVIFPTVNIIISEVKKMNETYFGKNKKKIEKVIVTGGSANLFGLIKCFSDELNIPVEIGNPWKNITYNKVLVEKLKGMSSDFSVAAGLALREFEE